MYGHLSNIMIKDPSLFVAPESTNSSNYCTPEKMCFHLYTQLSLYGNLEQIFQYQSSHFPD